MPTFDQYGAEYVRLVSASDPPTTGQFGARLLRPIDDTGADAVFGQPQTPYLSDIDAAGFGLTGLDLLGIGSVTLSAQSTVVDETYDELVLGGANACVFVIGSANAFNGVFCFESFDDVIANSAPHFLRAAGSHDVGIGIPYVGNVWNCAAGTGAMTFNSDCSFTGFSYFGGSSTDDGSGAVAQISGGGVVPALSIQDGTVLIGSTTDDGSGATVQITGSLSINGVLVTAP